MQNLKTLTIGDVVLKNRYILAPMAGISDLPFRLLCQEFGAGLTCMEMVSAKAIAYKNQKTFSMLKTGEGEHPVSLQLFGNEPDLMAETVKFLEDYPFDIIDVNMGCPVPKVVNNGEGSALLKNPRLAAEIIKKMVVATKKPVTAKIRIGFSSDSINAVEMAKMLEDAGVAAITVHGRTREQYYEGAANWKIIANVKRTVGIPIIGNGDIFSPKDAKRMYEETGVDGFAIARGVKGNPWIFKEMIYFEETGEVLSKPGIYETCEVIMRHAESLIAEKGDYIGIREMRKHTAWYLAGCKNASKIRGKLNGISSLDELRGLLDSLNN